MTFLIQPFKASFSLQATEMGSNLNAYCTLTIGHQRNYTSFNLCEETQANWCEELVFKLDMLYEDLWVELWVKQLEVDKKIGEGNIDLRRHYNKPSLIQNERIDLRVGDNYSGTLHLAIQYVPSEEIQILRQNKKKLLPQPLRHPVIDDLNDQQMKKSVAKLQLHKSVILKNDKSVNNTKNRQVRGDIIEHHTEKQKVKRQQKVPQASQSTETPCQKDSKYATSETHSIQNPIQIKYSQAPLTSIPQQSILQKLQPQVQLQNILSPSQAYKFPQQFIKQHFKQPSFISNNIQSQYQYNNIYSNNNPNIRPLDQYNQQQYYPNTVWRSN